MKVTSIAIATALLAFVTVLCAEHGGPRAEKCIVPMGNAPVLLTANNLSIATGQPSLSRAYVERFRADTGVVIVRARSGSLSPASWAASQRVCCCEDRDRRHHDGRDDEPER